MKNKIVLTFIEKTSILLVIFAILIPREYNLRFCKLSVSVTDITFIFLLLVFIFNLLKGKVKFTKTKITSSVTIAMLCVVAIGILNIFIKGVENKHIFFRDIYVFLIPIVFLIVFNLCKLRIINVIIPVIFILHLLLSMWSIAIVEIPLISNWYISETKQIAMISSKIGYFNPSGNTGSFTDVGTVRPANLIGGMGHIGWLSIICLPIYLSCFQFLKQKFGLFVLSASLFFMFLAVLYLMSRSVIIALILPFLILLWSSRINKKTKHIFLSLIFFSLLIFYINNYGNLFINRFSNLKSLSNITSSKNINKWPTSSQARYKIYSKSIDIIKENPFFGMGMGNSFELTLFKNDDMNWTDNFYSVDSFYLTLLLKLGIIGILFIIIFLYLIYLGHKVLKNNKLDNSLNFYFTLGTLSSIIGFLSGGLFGYGFHSPSFNIMFWVILAFYAKYISLEVT